MKMTMISLNIMVISIKIIVISMNIHINYLKIVITILTILSTNVYTDTLSLTTHFQLHISIYEVYLQIFLHFYHTWTILNTALLLLGCQKHGWIQLMCQPMASVVITMYIEREVHAKVVVFPSLCQNKCIYSEMANHCMVNDYIESLFVKITNNGMTFVFGIVYRPPNSDIVQFTETLNSILGEISHIPCYIMGDYSIDLLKNELHPPTEKILEVMYQNSLLPMIFKPTRETETTATLIGNIFTNLYKLHPSWKCSNLSIMNNLCPNKIRCHSS